MLKITSWLWRRHINYTFSASQSYDKNNKEEERFNLFISIPFYWGDDIAKTRHQINLSDSTSFSKVFYSSTILEITGIAGERDQLNYGIYMLISNNKIMIRYMVRI